MGPLRRRLIAAAPLALSAAPAAAQSCAEVRPGWNGEPVSAWGEVLFLAQSPIVLILILLTALAVRFRSEWGGLLVVVGWSIATYLATNRSGAGDALGTAMAEGCVGNPALFIAFAAALCIGVVVYTAPIGKRKQN